MPELNGGWDKSVTADAVITRLIENQGIYTLCNRGYDALVQPGATSVRRPRLPLLKVKKNTGTASNSADRKKAKADTKMIETELDVYAVPIANEVAAKFESNDFLRTEFEVSASMSLSEQFDTDCIAAAQATTNRFNFKEGELSWKDITGIKAFFTKKKIPRDKRILVVDADLEDAFWNLPVIEKQTGYNITTLQNGTFTNLLGFNIFFSALAPKINDKSTITAWYGPGLAFILNRIGEIKEGYNPEELQDDIDLLAHAAAELDNNDFACVIGEQGIVAP